jgi:hypothetical protein
MTKSRSMTNSSTTVPQPSPSDRRAWALARAGVSEEEIAGRLRTDIAKVKSGIAAMEAWKSSLSHDVVDATMNQMVIGRINQMGAALDDALAAERVRVDMEGNVIQEPDHMTRLDALEKISMLVRDIRPRGGDKGVAVNILNQNSNANIAGAGGRSFEARVRAVREARGLRAMDTATVAEAVEEEGEVGEEDEDIPEGEIVEDEVEPDYPEDR